MENILTHQLSQGIVQSFYGTRGKVFLELKNGHYFVTVHKKTGNVTNSFYTACEARKQFRTFKTQIK